MIRLSLKLLDSRSLKFNSFSGDLSALSTEEALRPQTWANDGLLCITFSMSVCLDVDLYVTSHLALLLTPKRGR